MPAFADLRNADPHSTVRRMLTGAVPAFACTYDPRFSFSLYVPKIHSFAASHPPLPLLVIIHGTRRQTETYLTKLKTFAETHKCIIMCPLFPAGIVDPTDINNYKDLIYEGIRFDRVLLGMIDQVGSVWRAQTEKFFLHGFSGGGQFAHRFFYLYPSRIAAVSIGAAGRITPPSTHPEHTWPGGLADVHDIFGVHPPDLAQLAHIPVQMIVGGDDLDTSMLKAISNPNWAENQAGGTRLDRMKWLRDAWVGKGMKVDFSVVPGVGHNGIQVLGQVEAWLTPLVDAAAKKHHG